MRQTAVAWAVCLLPVLAGCGTVRNWTTERHVAHTQSDSRKDARLAWQTVRERNPKQVFTTDFQDGFLDGFITYLDRDKKFSTSEGHSHTHDYYLGFKYGIDVAIASGRRPEGSYPVVA